MIQISGEMPVTLTRGEPHLRVTKPLAHLSHVSQIALDMNVLNCSLAHFGFSFMVAGCLVTGKKRATMFFFSLTA